MSFALILLIRKAKLTKITDMHNSRSLDHFSYSLLSDIDKDQPLTAKLRDRGTVGTGTLFCRRFWQGNTDFHGKHGLHGL